MKTVGRVAIVGSGTIGTSWATLFLARGLDVSAWDPAANAAERLRAGVASLWPSMTALGLAAGASQGRLRCHDTLEAALNGVDFVQESGPENLAAKQALYAQMDAALDPEVVIATSSSGLLMSQVQAHCQHPGRCIVGHPFNPPHLVPLVELVAGKRTETKFIEIADAFYRSVGKRPIRVKKEVPGHIANRLQAALWREAVYLVQQGVASVEDIDTAVAYGPGLRWALMGPHMTLHLGGGAGGLKQFIHHIGPAFQAWWEDLGTPRLEDKGLAMQLVSGVSAEAGTASYEALTAERDMLLLEVLKVVANKRALP